MRRILTTTAIIALTSMPLYAEQHTTDTNEASASVTVGEQEFRASNVMGATVYMPSEGAAELGDEMEIDGVPEGWTEIGSVEDLFLGNGGEVATVVFSPNDEISSDKDRIGVETASVEFKKAADSDEFYIVYTGDKVTLEESEEFDQAAAEAEGQTSAADEQNTQQEQSEDQNTQQAQSDDQTMQSDQDEQMQQAENAETQKDGLTIRASNLTGHAVYVPVEGTDVSSLDEAITEAPDDWERVGDIGNVIVSRDGEIKSVTLDAGGFLGVGEKEIETSMDELRFVADSDSDADSEFFIVFTGDRSQLEEGEYSQAAVEDRGDTVLPGAGQRSSDNETATDDDDMSNEDMAAEENADMSDDEMADSDSEQEQEGSRQMTSEETAQLSAEELEGQTVYGTNGENIGDVSTLIFDQNGEIELVIVDVGGFLGIGEKPVALPFEELNIRQSTDGFGSIEVSTQHTEEELENMERWES